MTGMTHRGLTVDEAMVCAIHEAGHCIAAVVLGLYFDYATILPDGDRMGHTAIKNPLLDLEIDSPPYRQKCEEGLVQAWAGSFAELIVGRVNKDAINGGNGSDLEFIFRTADYLSGGSNDEALKLIGVAERRSRELIVSCAGMVAAVAHALYCEGKLTPAEVLEILKDQPIEDMRRCFRSKWSLPQ